MQYSKYTTRAMQHLAASGNPYRSIQFNPRAADGLHFMVTTSEGWTRFTSLAEAMQHRDEAAR